MAAVAGAVERWGTSRVDQKSAGLAVGTVLALVLQACGLPGPVNLRAHNLSDAAVIVQFDAGAEDPGVRGYLVPAGAEGLTLEAWRTWNGDVRVFDESCRLLWEGTIDAGHGTVIIGANRDVEWSTEVATQVPLPDDNGRIGPRMAETTECGAP